VLPIFWSRVFVAADRYAYFSYIGLFLLIAFVIERVLSMEYFRNMYTRYTAIGMVIIYGLFLGYLSQQQSKYWLETIMLLSRAVDLSESAPAKAVSHFYRANAYQNLAEIRYREGQMAQDEKTVRDAFFFYRYAVSDYDSTMKYNPGHMLAYTNRGIIYATMAPHDNKYFSYALKDYEKAISIDPEYADNYYNMGWIYFLQKDVARACELWRKADELGSAVAWQAIEQNCK
jgi:tetratricopeptide (TPR) repeat protein